MAEVNTVGGVSGAAAYARPDPLDVATEIIGRDASADPARLVRDATSAAAQLEAIANPTAKESAALDQLHGLIDTLTTPAPDAAPAPAKTWVASGAAKAKSSAAPAPTAPAVASAAKPVAKALTLAGPPEAVSVDVTTGSAKLNAPMTMRELAANAFGIAADQVGDTHLALLAQNNEALAKLKPDEKIPAGTTVSLSNSPRVADLQRKATITGLETVDKTLSEARSAKPDSPNALSPQAVLELTKERARLVDEGKALQTQLPNLRAYDAIGKSEAQRNKAIEALGSGDEAKAAPLLAGARKELDTALAAKDLPPGAQAVLLKRRGELSLLEATAASQPAALTAFRQKNGSKTVAQLTDLPPDIQATAKKTLATVSDNFKKAKTDLQASAAQYREQLKTAAPEDKERLTTALKQADADVAGLAGREQAALGAVHATLGNTGGQLESIRKELDAVMPGGGALLQKTVEKHITEDGKTASALSWLGSTKVGVMNTQTEQAFKDSLSKLTPEQQNKALAVVAKYGEAGATTGDVTAMNTSRQVLEARAATDPKGPWASQAALTKGSYMLSLGNPKAATEAFREAQTKASSITDPATKKSAETRAVLGEASALSAGTREGSPSEKAAAATALQDLRKKQEARKPPLLDKSSLAQLTLSEVNGFLGPNKSKDADASLAYLKKTYGGNGPDGKPEVKWLSDSIKGFESTNREGGAKAFTQVLMSEMEGRQSGGTKLAIIGSGMAAGAAVGVFGGGIGAIPGALIGGGVAGIGLLTANAAMGMGNAWQAGQTGLARQTWLETMTDGVGIVTDVVGGAAPVRGLALVGKAGLSAAAGGLDEAAMAALKSSSAAVESKFGTEAFAKLSKGEQEDAARKMLLKDFSNSTLKVGGAAVPAAGLSVAAAGVAKGLVDINNDASLNPAQKSAARTKLLEGIGKSLVNSVPQMALQAAVHQSATSGLSADLRKAVNAAAAGAAKTTAVRLDEPEYKAKLAAAAENEIKSQKLTGKAADDIRAHYDAIAQKGEAYVDVATGNVFFNKATPEAGTAEMLRHEVAHRGFHELPLNKRTELVEKFKSDPNNKAIRDAVAADNPHSGGFTDLQIIDEYQAMVRAQAGSGKGLSGASPTFDKALESAGLKGVKDLNTDKFLKDGTIDLGAYRARSGERVAMGASSLTPEKLKTLASIGRDFPPLRNMLNVQDIPEVRAKLARINPERMQEMTVTKNGGEWGNVLGTGRPPAAAEALFKALESDSPDALKALMAQKVDAVASGATAVPPPAVARPPAPAAAPAKPAAPAVATPLAKPTVAAGSDEAKAAIEALGGFAASPLKTALSKASADEAKVIGDFAKALKTPIEGVSVDKTKLAEAFAKADGPGRAALVTMLEDAATARSGVKAMGGYGSSSMSSAIEAALKSANPAAMKSLASLTEGLSGKLDGSIKEAVAKSARAAAEKNDLGALGNLATNVERLKDPAAAARFAQTIKLASDGSRIGEILSQPNAEKVSALRVFANRKAAAGTELDPVKLAKLIGAGDKVADFLGKEASADLVQRLASGAKTTDADKLISGAAGKLWDNGTAELLRALDKHSGADLEKFATKFINTEDLGHLRTFAEREKYVNYQMALEAAPSTAPSGLHLDGGTGDWKLGQGIDPNVNIGKLFNAERTSTEYAGNRLMEQLGKLRDARDAGQMKKPLEQIQTELHSLNTEVAVRTSGNRELADKLVQLEAQVKAIRKMPNAEDQWRAIRALSK